MLCIFLVCNSIKEATLSHQVSDKIKLDWGWVGGGELAAHSSTKLFDPSVKSEITQKTNLTKFHNFRSTTFPSRDIVKVYLH